MKRRYTVDWHDDEHLTSKQRSEVVRAADILLSSHVGTQMDERALPASRFLPLGTRHSPRSVLMIATAKSSTVESGASLPASPLLGEIVMGINADMEAKILIHAVEDRDPVSLWTISQSAGPRASLYRVTRNGLVAIPQKEFDELISNPPKEYAVGITMLLRSILGTLRGENRGRVLSMLQRVRDGALWDRAVFEIARRTIEAEGLLQTEPESSEDTVDSEEEPVLTRRDPETQSNKAEA